MQFPNSKLIVAIMAGCCDCEIRMTQATTYLVNISFLATATGQKSSQYTTSTATATAGHGYAIYTETHLELALGR